MDAPQIEQQGKGVRTLAFFDLETTGLQHEQPRMRVTELSIVAVTVADLRAASPRLPRILHKLTMCMNPCSPVHPIASQVSGLDNFMLEGHPTFKTATCDTLESFLQRLPPPVCLVAHDGHRFYFSLLTREFLYAKRAFPNNILCADTLPCFRELLNPEKVPKQVIPRRRRNFGATQQSCSQNCHKLDSSELEAKTVGVAEAAEREPQQTPEMPPVTIQESTPNKRKKPKSFREDDLVQQLAPEFKADTLQSVEGDVMALLHCASARVDQFVPWINEHAEVFPVLKASKIFSQRRHI
ncbi:three-prime repair exonuclease 1-like isoform X2 [Cloeon dipterum]